MSLNIHNEYVDVLPGTFYADIPKAVWAAMFISYLRNLHNVEKTDLLVEIMREWYALHDNGIVPQKPMTSYSVKRQKVKLPTREELQSM